jgi:hypothetical protein
MGGAPLAAASDRAEGTDAIARTLCRPAIATSRAARISLANDNILRCVSRFKIYSRVSFDSRLGNSPISDPVATNDGDGSLAGRWVSCKSTIAE